MVRLSRLQRLLACSTTGGLLLVAGFPTASVAGDSPARRGFNDTLADAGFVALHRGPTTYVIKAHAQIHITLKGVAPDSLGTVVSLAATAAHNGSLTLYAVSAKRPALPSLVLTAGHHAAAQTVLLGGKGLLYNGTSQALKVALTVQGYFPSAGKAFAGGAPGWFTATAPKKAVSVRLGKHATTKYKTLLAAPPRVASVVLAVSATGTRKGVLRSFAWHSHYKTQTTLPLAPGAENHALQTIQPSGEHWVGMSNLSGGSASVKATALGYVLPFHSPTQVQYLQATAHDGRAVVAWQPPLDLGGLAVTSYVVTVLPDGPTKPGDRSFTAPGSAADITIPLANNHPYWFEVTPINAAGTGSAASTNIPVIPTRRPSPSGVRAAATSSGDATVTWTAPPGPLPASYTVTGSRLGTIVVSAPATSAVLPISGRVVETFTVTANDADGGTSSPSAPSAPVTVGGIAGPGPTTRVSSSALPGVVGVSPQLRDDTLGVSAQGRYVAFASTEADLVLGDTNNARDVFVRDTSLGTTTLVSLATNGTLANGDSGHPVISDDGRYVSFDSNATNLVAGGTTGTVNVFRHDLTTGATVLVSVGISNAQSSGFGPAMSGDGKFIAFTSEAANVTAGDTNGASDVFVRDMNAGSTVRASLTSLGAEPDSDSGQPSISADGHLVTFTSFGSNLAAGDANDSGDVFVRDLVDGTTTLVSANAAGMAEPQGTGARYSVISADGRFVAFETVADDLVTGDTNHVGGNFVRNLATGVTRRISVGYDGSQAFDDDFYRPMAISADGQRIAFSFPEGALIPDSQSGTVAVFLFDQATGRTSAASVANDGTSQVDDTAAVGLAADGRSIAFGAAFGPQQVGSSNPGVFLRTIG
jgi:Tol biopolymer transport system component